MEYQFVRGLTGEYKVICSMDHEVVGRWLEQEVYTDKARIEKLLEAIKQIKAGAGEEFLFTGKEISVSLQQGDVIIEENALHSSDELDDSEFDFYNSESTAECGLEDFEQLLVSWQKFIR